MGGERFSLNSNNTKVEQIHRQNTTILSPKYAILTPISVSDYLGFDIGFICHGLVVSGLGLGILIGHGLVVSGLGLGIVGIRRVPSPLRG